MFHSALVYAKGKSQEAENQNDRREFEGSFSLKYLCVYIDIQSSSEIVPKYCSR